MDFPGIKLNNKVLFLFLLFPTSLFGQQSVKSDTIKIREVMISRKQVVPGQPGFKKISVDTTLIRNYTLSPISQTLNESSQMFMKNYGAGGIATTSFRGAGASRTKLAWNGININDPMLGQSDFSLIPSGMVDGIQISFGGASMEIGSGGIGGIINLENIPVWTRQTNVEINPGAGSFGSYALMSKVKTGNLHFQSVTKAYIKSSENDFPFLNADAIPSSVWQTRKNGSESQKGFMQELYFKKSEKILSARVWYQTASRHLAGSTLYEVPDSAEYQADESLRSLLTYDVSRGKNDFFIDGAWMYTRLDYSFAKYFIESKNRTNTIVLKGGMTTRFSDFTRLKIFITEEMNSVVSGNYSGNEARNTASLTVTAEHKSRSRFGTVILLREILNDGRLMVPDYSAGFEFRLIRGEEHFLKLNFARNSIIPTMNDLHWSPGGNPALKNEYTYSYELGYSMDHRISDLLTLNSEFTVFTNYIRDMIQWHPDTGYYWIAENIGSVNTSGFESMLSLKYVFNDFRINLISGYSFTRAQEISSETPGVNGKQLVYVPENRANGSLQLTFKHLYLFWVTNFTGRTWTTDDNSSYLPGYTLNNVTAGMKFKLNESSIDLNFRVDNLLNVSYQAIAHYPQPGRSYFLNLLFSFISKPGEK